MTARDIILALRARGFSDGAIAKAINSERATIAKIRNRTPNYSGKLILFKLEELARLNNINLSASRPSQVIQKQPKQKLSIFQKRCMLCPKLPPGGLNPAEFYQWIKEHPCDRQQRGGCPA